jgi:hypothetical protein
VDGNQQRSLGLVRQAALDRQRLSPQKTGLEPWPRNKNAVSLKEPTAEVLCWDENGDRNGDQMKEACPGSLESTNHPSTVIDRALSTNIDKANSVPNRREGALTHTGASARLETR